MKYTLLSLAAAATSASAAAISSLASSADANAASTASSARSAVQTASVFSGSYPTRSFATGLSASSATASNAGPYASSSYMMSSYSSYMPSSSMASSTMSMNASATASATATGAAGGGSGSGSSSSSSCKPNSVPASATVLPNRPVPTGEVIQGDYTGFYRPQVHFSPPKGFMNDPNGCHRDDNGTWHLYYQYNPYGYVAGNQHWGHATSDDLYSWQNQPIAIYPPNSTTQVFSGSAVIDKNNTSGFFPNQTDGVVAVYTLNSPTLQVQEIAYSRDGGYSFTPYAQNPVLDIGSSQFRDPKVFWYEDHWVMAVALANDYVIQIYTSPNLTSWDFASNFSHHGLLGLAYECPNLIEVPYRDEEGKKGWVMYISINPGAPLGGSVGQYMPGDFNGTHFTAVDSAARIADFGKDLYAEQFMANVPGEAISIAWASNWQYSQSVPTADQGFRSAMTLPRRNYLANITRLGWDLVSLPYDLSPVVGESLASNKDITNSSAEIDFSNVSSNAIQFNVSVSLPDSANYSSFSSLNVTFMPSKNFSDCSSLATSSPVAKFIYFYGGLTSGAISLSRPTASSSWAAEDPYFTNIMSETLVDPLTNLEGVFDRSLLEVFVNGGEHTGTMSLFPDVPAGSMKVETGDLPAGSKVTLTVNGLKSVWQSN